MLEDLGFGNITVNGVTIAAVTWVWRKLNGVEDKMSKLELKVAENYVTKPELKAIDEKLDRHNEIINSKIDNITTILIARNRNE